MINKISIDNENVEITGASTPYYHTFPQAKVHTVKFGLDSGNEICAYAFSGCKNLTYIDIPENITMIKRGAFKNCSSLPTINIKNTIEYVGKEAFDGCENLKEIIIDHDDPHTISFFANVPESATCFVPNGAKYVKVENFDDIDLSGETQYYSRTAWNEYQEIIDPSDIEEENFGEDLAHTAYLNQWSHICPGNQLKEMKDLIPVTGISLYLKQSDNSLIPLTNFLADADDTFEVTYILEPENTTNTTLTWMSNASTIININDNTGKPGLVSVKTNNTSTNTIVATIATYSDSGHRAAFTLTIKGNNVQP